MTHMKLVVVLRPPVGRPLRLLLMETPHEMSWGANGGIPFGYDGLLFSFDPPVIPTMTMRRTPLPLRILFVGPDHVVHTMHDAKAHSGDYTTDRPTRWVVELPVASCALTLGDALRLSV